MMTCLALAVLILACFAAYFVISVYLKSRYLPPGPFPWPLIGNLHLLSSKPYIDFYRLTKTYGPVFRLKMGCNQVVVINNYTYAKEAMLKKGADFAGRPSHYVGSLFSRNGKGVGFQTFSEMFKKQHRAISNKIKERTRKEPKLEMLVSKEVDDLICRIRGKGEGPYTDPLVYVTFAFGNIVSTLAFGERYREDDNEFWQLMDALAVFVQGLIATSFIDTFPFLKFVPFGIIKKVKKAVDIRDTILNKIYKEHKSKAQNSNNNKDPSDLTDHLIKLAQAKPQGSQKNEFTDDHIVMTVNDIVMAGSESPTMNFMWILVYLIKYPDVQERIHRELNDVVGGKRAPQWDERRKLPYLEAFFCEVFRHSTVMPLAIPHEAICDSTIYQYQIPKGTTILLNIYAIHHDPEVWEKPMEFNPDRFLEENGHLSSETAKKIIPFGLGHRICPGEVLARMEAFLFTSRIVKNFKVKGDETEVLPDINDCSFGITLRPSPFKLCLVPRK